MADARRQGDEELKELERVLGELTDTLATCKRTLPRLRVASVQHMQHYAEVMQWLETRKDSIFVSLCREKAMRLKSLADRNASYKENGSLRMMVPKQSSIYKDESPPLEVLQLSEQERVQLQLENEQLRLEEMNRLTDQARDLQRQLGTIGQLMTVFSLEIVRQREDMLRIIDVTVKATINVELGNKQLVEATSSSVDFRFFVLLFLIILSVALIFLQWYS